MASTCLVVGAEQRTLGIRAGTRREIALESREAAASHLNGPTPTGTTPAQGGAETRDYRGDSCVPALFESRWGRQLGSVAVLAVLLQLRLPYLGLQLLENLDGPRRLRADLDRLLERLPRQLAVAGHGVGVAEAGVAERVLRIRLDFELEDRDRICDALMGEELIAHLVQESFLLGHQRIRGAPPQLAELLSHDCGPVLQG